MNCSDESALQARIEGVANDVWEACGESLLAQVKRFRPGDAETDQDESAVRGAIAEFLQRVAEEDPMLTTWRTRENRKLLEEYVKAAVKHTPHYNEVFTKIWETHAASLQQYLWKRLRGSRLQAKVEPHEEVRRGISHFLSVMWEKQGTIDSWMDHTRLLSTIVIAKQRDRIIEWSAKKRSVEREEPLGDNPICGGEPPADQILTQQEYVQLLEELTEKCMPVEKPKRRVVQHWLEGRSRKEIARKLNLPAESVEDIVDDFIAGAWRELPSEYRN